MKTFNISPSKKPAKTVITSRHRTLGLLFVAAAALSNADDTQVYLDLSTLPPVQTRPNVVFVLDSSGSMGLPVESSTARVETSNYDSSKIYDGNANYSGGAGDTDYYYLYSKPNTFADQYIYFNKVHKDQMTCDMSTLGDTTPYTTSSDKFVYDSGGTDWSSGGTSQTFMCAEHEASCGFTADINGPLVDCNDEENYVSINGSYGTSLYVVSANYHNFLQQYYRYTTLLTVMKDLIDKNYDINASMMQFNGGSGGYVFHESIWANDPNDPTNANQQSLRDALDNIYLFDDSTPVTETLWEASRYLRGLSADYGDNSGTDTPSAAYSSGTTYNSPIQYACQKSHIILLTDGEPTSDNDRDSQIEGSSYYGSNCSGSCLDELADWIRNDDSNNPSGLRDHSSSLPDDQTIAVHTIGFGTADYIDTTLLNNTATKGGGLFRLAAKADELASAFNNILEQVEFEADTSVAPAVAVNAYSGLQHREELYFALFQPEASPRWNGNIKKFKLIDGQIVDVNDDVAIDSDTGFFEPDAKSYWTTPRDLDGDGNTDFSLDGDDIKIGGAATQLTTPTSRKMYTYTGAAPVFSVTAPSPVTLSNENLDLNSSNAITDNIAIAASPTLLGPSVTTTAYAQEIVDWARGGIADATPNTANPNPPNYFYPDIIHNSPVVVTYETDTTSSGCTDDDPCFTDVIYAGSNMGTFYAINPETGNELWSFVPSELLPNLTTYYEEVGGFTAKVYGLDGEMQVWRKDNDKNGNIDGSDHVYLYQPMRRGGSDIYAFDLTDKASPKLMWQIEGTGLDASPSGRFDDLAQTWSSPQRTAINWDGTKREVLFFGGGYDPLHDANNTTPAANGTGNAIYMVDATTSELLWSAGASGHNFNNTSMAYSFPSNVFTADVDGDDFVDFLYAVDVTGNVWRFDFDNDAGTPISAGGVTGGLVAELGGSGTDDFRRFYNAPDVAFFSPRGQQPFLTISIASGHRSDPREEDLDDFLFVFFDPYATTHPGNYNYDGGSSTITASELGVAGTPNALGWRLALSGTGEKGLAQTVTFDGSIMMTTYLPDSTATCEGSIGTGRFYLLNALTGESTLPDDSTADPNDTLLFSPLIHPGIPPEPALIYGTTEVCIKNCEDNDSSNDVMSKTTEITACVGTECLDYKPPFEGKRAYWRNN